MWVSDVSSWVMIEEWFAFLTVVAHCVVTTVITDTATDAPRGLVNSRVKVTFVAMVITVAL